MSRRASEIFREFSEGGLLVEFSGEDCDVSGTASVEACGPGDLVFVDKADFVPYVKEHRPSAVVTSRTLQPDFDDVERLAVLVASNVGLAHALLRQRYWDRQVRETDWGDIHPSATKHPSASIGPGSVVGPNAVIGAEVQIGRDCAIMAGSVIERGARIGDSTVVHPNVTVGYDCIVGDEVIIKSGSVIGSEGYGFAQDERGKSHRIPQRGKVVIEDRVAIGACCCIDRATYSETRIGAGTKIDNLCHIAHNVTIGADCLLTAGFIVAGSTRIGNRVVASGQTGVLDHLSICDDVVLLHRAGVTDSIDEPGRYAGLPLQPLREYFRNTAIAKTLADLRKRLRELERRLKRE